QIERDEDCRVVIVKSDVAGCFCAGADLKERASLSLILLKPLKNWLQNLFGQMILIGTWWQLKT
uniref:Uncharacterized protein n=1 Tax=Romanomermis culicivorax TaxID=13658 RepID=A0A915K0L4_ROMCU